MKSSEKDEISSLSLPFSIFFVDDIGCCTIVKEKEV